MKRLLSIIILLSAFAILYSQSNQGINYQAVARSSSGDLLSNQDLKLRISFLQSSSTVWIEEHEVVTNPFGVFNLVIGSPGVTGQGSAGSFSQIAWAEGDISMRIELDQGDGYQDMGMTELQAVPYALFAVTSGDGPAGPQGPQGEQGPPGDPASDTDDQTLNLEGGILSISEGNSVDLNGVISSSAWEENTDTISTYKYVGIGTNNPNQSPLAVQGMNINSQEPLFEVRREDGLPVFAVFNDGVMVYVDETAKGVKGGFAVGGYNRAGKGVTQEYLRVTADSVRIFVPEEPVGKGIKGGFAVGGYNRAGKGSSQDFMFVTPDSIRMYVPNKENDPGYVGLQGGFAVETFDPNLSGPQPREYIMGVNRGITRFNTADDSQGFAIGSQGGDWGATYMEVTPVNTFIGYQSGRNTSSDSTNWDVDLGVKNLFLGYQAGASNTLGSFNTFIGYQSGEGLTGGESPGFGASEQNVFIGYRAGANMFDSYQNIMIGRSAGENSGEGQDNIFIGSNAGNEASMSATILIGKSAGELGSGADNIFIGQSSGALTEGDGNVFIGPYTGSNQSIFGDYNTFLGYESGSSVGGGDYNTYIGARAGQYNISNRNVAVGYEAGKGNNSSYFQTTLLGYQAGYSLTDAETNTFIGSSSGYSVTAGVNNVFLGAFSGYSMENGVGNVLIGNNSGGSNTADNNIMIGNYAGSQNSGGSGNIFIGNSAGYYTTSSNELYVENSSSSTPLIYGNFANDILQFNGDVSINTSDNASARLTVQETLSNDFGAAILGIHTSTPNYGTGVRGDGGDYGVVGNASVIGAGSRVGVSGQASGGSANYGMTASAFNSTSNTGIWAYASGTYGSTNYGVYAYATGGTSYALYANGDIVYTGSSYYVSDGKLKKNIADIKEVLPDLMKIRPRSYSFIENTKSSASLNLPASDQFGFIAQEIEEIFPGLVVEIKHELKEPGEEGDPSDAQVFKGVKYMEMIPLLLKGMQEQQEEIEALKARIKELEGN